MKKIILLFVLVSVVWLSVPHQADAFSLVPCGGTGQSPCEFKHFIILITRVINYLMSVAAIVAVFMIVVSGFKMVFAAGSPEEIGSAKAGVANAVVGFALIILAFVVINLVMTSLFKDPQASKNWWDTQCLYGVTSGCPFVP